MRSLAFGIILATCLLSSLEGQETSYGPGYSMLLIGNPAMSGLEPAGRFSVSYLNFYPGRNFRLHSVLASFDSYFPGIHGGAGFYISDDYHGGIMNDLRSGFSYAYMFKAGNATYLSAGLSSSFFHRGFNFTGALLPDQIDPLGRTNIPSGESLRSSGRTAFDVSTGIIIFTPGISAGLAIDHLSQPDISFGQPEEKLYRKLILHAAGDIELKSTAGYRLRPLAYVESQHHFTTAGPGILIGNPAFSVNMLVLANNNDALDLQTGFSFTSGKLDTFFNYRFNLLSPDNMLPFSLVLQTGLSWSLNNVEKRNNAGSLIFPKL
jgi:type IX secretion system PorP/SprF family membrane protein